MSQPRTPVPDGTDRTQLARSRDAAAKRDRAVITYAGAAVADRLVTAAGSLVSVGLAARALTHAELGVVSVLTALLVYFGFGDFGLGSMLMTRLPAAHARDDHAEMRQLVSSVMSALLVVAAVVAAVGTASIFVVPWRAALGAGSISPSELRWTLLAFMWIGAIGIVGSVGSRILIALQRGVMVRVGNVVAAVVSVVSVVVCSGSDAPTWAYVIALAAPVTVAGLAQLGVALILFPYLALDRNVLDLAVGARFLRSGLQYAVLSIGWVVAYTLDAVVVAWVLGAAEAAVFAIAARLFNLITGTLTVAGQQMWPAIAEAWERGDVEWVRKRFRHSLLVAAATSAASSIGLVIVGPAVARVWVGAQLVPPSSLFVVFAVWTVYMTVMTQYSYLLLARDRIRVLAVLGLVVAGANLSASVLFTRWLGLPGPIVGNLAAAAFVQLIPTIVLSRRLLRDIDHPSVVAVPGGHGHRPPGAVRATAGRVLPRSISCVRSTPQVVDLGTGKETCDE